MEDTVEVDVDDLAPLVEADVGEAAEAVLSGGVHQDGDRSQCGAYLAEGGIDLSPVGDVGDVGELGVRRVQVEDGHAIAVGPQSGDDRRPDPGTAAGHHCGLRHELLLPGGRSRRRGHE